MSARSSRAALTKKPLVRSSWSRIPLDDDLSLVLDRVESSTDTTWYGIIWSTVGAVSVVADENGLRTCAGDAVDLKTIYELRLWAPSAAHGDNGRGLWARELRWLNGSGGVDLRVFSDPSEGETCWCRAGAYVQHSPSGSGKVATMSTVEVFCEEQSYSNVVFVDELMTGKWA